VVDPTYREMNASDGPCDVGPFFLDVTGTYLPEDVTVQWSDSPRPTNREVEDLIERAWAERTGGGTKQSPRLFNGRLCRLIDCKPRKRKLTLTLGAVSFKEFLGTNVAAPHIRYVHGPEVLADALGVSAAITTRDGFLVLGRRSDRVAHYPGKIHPIGGVVERTEDGPPGDLFQALCKEIHEETHLPPERIGPIVGLGLVRDKQTVQPEFIFDVQVDAGLQTLRRSWADAADAGEHSEILSVRNSSSAVVSFIEQYDSELTPLAVAALMLHGQRQWGSGWFVSTRGYLRQRIG